MPLPSFKGQKFGDEYEFPDEIEEKTKQAAAEDKFEIEIEDDTPPADRNRRPMREPVEDPTDEELESYDEKVQNRIKKFTRGYHDERRRAESAEREREEAVRYAQQIIEENKKLKTTLSSGEETYIETLKNGLEHQLTLAKREYREAYDSGDAEKIIEAQAKMNDAQYKLSQASMYKPKYKEALQDDKNDVYIPQNEQPSFRPDDKALKWQEKNEWFGKDEEMTSLALGLHEKLVRSGISPTSDEYYRRIDTTMQKRFPEYFGDATLDEEKPAERTKPSTVVAPATRSTAPKTIKISKSAAMLAKKLGITPEQYARETLKLERTNG